jgi:hypothetical protein
MAEAVGGEIFKRLEKNSGKRLLVLFLDFKNLLGSLKRLIALWMADFSEDKPCGGGGGETNLG